MKRILKRGLSLFVILIITISISTFNVMAENTSVSIESMDNGKSDSNVPVDGFYYEYIEDSSDGGLYTGVKITKYAGSEQNIVIPQNINGYLVIEIGEEAFKGCTNLTSVIVTKTITNISKAAFENCSNLKKIVIPSTVINIGVNVFMGCRDLTIFGFEGSEVQRYAQ